MPNLFPIMMWCMYASALTPAVSRPPEHHIFFLGRASTVKSSLIAKEFNITDSLISHVGIGIIEHGALRIYHVEDKAGNAFSACTLDEFLSFGIFYYCVYSLPLSSGSLERIVNLLKEHPPVKFDKNLRLNNDDLYCSEFAYQILTSVEPEKFLQPPVTKKVTDQFARSYLGRDSISYIPVDFFLMYPGIRKIVSAFTSNDTTCRTPLED
ncbi:MAG: hypothetical protein EOO01_14260 [Chitinophagaceae bacterium]|nr:MAG: hypothetical protein EOO01_14260 [Chitinophagaceae bacterium]